MNLLTIVIPTYNRRERLLRQLRSIFSQHDSDKINVLICDNCSNYSVKDSIIQEFGDKENIEVVSNKYNVGGDANIAMTFLRCKTKWMWLLSDDDETTSDSIHIVLKDIEKHPDIAYFKYSIENFVPYEEKQVSTLEDFVDYYHFGHYSGGNLIFMSNNVYNLEIIGPCYRNTLMLSFCRISQLLPIFNMLNEGLGTTMFMASPIVKYRKPEKGSSWNMVDVSVGIASIPLMIVGLDKEHSRRLMRKIASGFPHGTIAKQCLAIENKYQGRLLYRHIYKYMFKGSRRTKDLLYYIAFNFLYFFGKHL